MESFDFAIIGAGMAGAAAAYAAAKHGSVLIIEKEDHPGYHTTGRSAALFSELYGNAVIQALTRGSREFFENPPTGVTDHPLLSRRGCIYVARTDQIDRIEQLSRKAAEHGSVVRDIGAEETIKLVPIMRPGYLSAAIFEPGARDIDVATLHSGFLKAARARGAHLATGVDIAAVSADETGWEIMASTKKARAKIVINAAGAWADHVARLAGVETIGINPLRRTVALVSAPGEADISLWPAIIDVDEKFYFKPDSGLILTSPADETPSEPCDAQPLEYDVALGIDRIQKAADLPVRHVKRAWAGLRSFAPDRSPVIGFAPDTPGFFWLAALGGYGIQTAPAVARMTEALLIDGRVPSDLFDMGVTIDAVSPARFMKQSFSPTAVQ